MASSYTAQMQRIPCTWIVSAIVSIGVLSCGQRTREIKHTATQAADRSTSASIAKRTANAADPNAADPNAADPNAADPNADIHSSVEQASRRNKAPHPACQCANSACTHYNVSFCDERILSSAADVTCFRGRGLGKDVVVMDIGPLACMTRLEQLSLVSGELEFILPLPLDDVSPLANLHTLKRLHLGHTTIVDIRPLEKLTGLRELSLHASRVRDVAPLSGLAHLIELDLSGTSVSDIGPLAQLTALQKLDLSATPVSDLSPLVELKMLTWLGLYSNDGLSPADIEAFKRARPDVRVTEGRRY